MSTGWDQSAAAWIADMGADGDWSRRYVLDAPLLARVRAAQPKTALDIGCGEGRFCRMLRAEGVSAIGIDPTQALIDHARKTDPHGDYRIGRGEALAFNDAQFDLVVFYLSLIDIEAFEQALMEAVRVLAPGGVLLIANLSSFNTAGGPDAWADRNDPTQGYIMRDYTRQRAEWAAWRGIRIQNWHRPLSAYMTPLLQAGLRLTAFDEPMPVEAPEDLKAARYRVAPWLMLMEWKKA